MKTTLTICIISLLMLSVFIGCNDQSKSNASLEPEKVSENNNAINTQAEKVDPNSAWVVFDVAIDKSVYQDSSNFGEPPQLAIWLENPQTNQVKTLWVSYRSGSGDWVGKIECPVALPYWFSRFNKETGTSGPPNFRTPAPVAITGATPETNLKVKRSLPGKERWEYFIEINVSADFNRTFSSETSQGMPDPHGNGQPSLIYKGTIDTATGKTTEPVLLGRSKQYHISDETIPDIQGITSAKNLLKSVKINYHPAK